MGTELRRLHLGNLLEAATVHRSAYDDRLPWLAGRHTPEEDRDYFGSHIFTACEVWGAFEHEGLVGYVAFRNEWVEHLYVLPGAQGRGIGRSLMALAKARGGPLFLWTFERNPGACRFYEREGFVAIDRTEGSTNEEREPDVLYRWTQ